MATISILGGYGAVGSRLCRLLIRAGHGIRIAGRSMEKAKKLSDELGPLAEPRCVDATVPASLDALCDGADILINTAGPYRIIKDKPARSALRNGIPYLDAAGDEYVMGMLEPEKESFALSGLPYLLSCGTYPGLSGMLPRAVAARFLDSVDSFSLYTDFSHSNVTFTSAFDIVATLQKDTGAGMAWWQDGKLRRDETGMKMKIMPGSSEKRVMYPCFSEEMRRMVQEMQIYEGHAYLALDEEALGGLFAACAPNLDEDQQRDAAEQLMKAYSTEVQETLFHVDVEGERDGLPAAYSATLHAPIGSLQFVSDVLCAAAEVVFEGKWQPGLNYMAGGLDADALMARLERGQVVLDVSSPE